MFDTIIHSWLRVPYTLSIRLHRRPRKPRATIIFIHGIGNTSDAWRAVIAGLPRDYRILTIDLLGFGKSPRPKDIIYDAKRQASSTIATLLKSDFRSPCVIVGHSLGTLVAIEMAKRHPKFVQGLVLCSPPLYHPTDDLVRIPTTDDALKSIFRIVQTNPERFVKVAAFAMKYGFVSDTFNVTSDNVDSYMASLKAIILNQSSLEDIGRLKMPVTILKGRLDPFVVSKHLRKLSKQKENISIKTVAARHEVRGRFVPATIDAINDMVTNTSAK